MQALVLVGGEGTRLRPLTLTQPKPAIRLVDRPFIRFMVDWLALHGVSEVVMACGFRAEDLRSALGDHVEGGPDILYLQEEEPLGTAGPIRLATDGGLLDERFLVLNGDVLTDLDLTALMRTHSEREAMATLGLYPVDDPTSYGLVHREGGPTAPGAAPALEDGAVTEFLEKPGPAEIDTDEVNAGAYVLEASIVDLIPPGRSVSIEREVFPRLVGQGLYARRLDGYWMDIGTPGRYLQASWDILEGRVRTGAAAPAGAGGVRVEEGARVDAAAEVVGPALVEDGCAVAAGAVVGPRAVLGAGSLLAEEAAVRGAVLGDGCLVGAGAAIEDAILAARVEVGEGARVGSGAVIGEGAQIGAGAAVAAGARVDPRAMVGA